jgi:hypothetical protein
MKRAMATAMVSAALSLMASTAQAQSGITGTWITHNFGDGPNLIDLQANGTRVTGTISRGQAVTHLYDGSISGNTVTFKASATGNRIITYTGRQNGDELAFTRSVQVVRAAGDGAGIYGSMGPMEFVATRELASGVPIPRALLGNWRENIQRSTFEPGPAPDPVVPMVRSFVSLPGGRVGLTAVTVVENGDAVMNFAILKADGRDYPFYTDVTLGEYLTDGAAPAGARTLRVVNERTFEITNLNNGIMVARRRLTVSPDGNTLTDVTTVVNAQGQTTAMNTIVSERIPSSRRPPTN